MIRNILKYFFKTLFSLYIAFGIGLTVNAQNKAVAKIETCDCNFKLDPAYLAIVPPSLKSDTIFQNNIDNSFKTECGYLVVPENRKKANSRTIKLPFIIVKSKNPNKKKDPVFFTAGGPGISSLSWANGITKSTLILDRDCIAFEQRGTKYARPYLRRFDLDIAMREAYRKNLPKDSMTIVGLKQYKKGLEKAGIDVSGYNTDETVADIHALLGILKIDSVNLFGGSYSGGLMLAVLQKDASKVRSLVLDSPLPTFVAIDEDEPANFLQALNVIFKRTEKDSINNKELYGNLKEKFNQYFTSIIDKKFFIKYIEKGTTDTLNIEYTKNEILYFIVNELSNPQIAFIITDIIKGNHSIYIKKRIDNIFDKNPAPDGMRISVYCADQAHYNNEEVINQLYTMYPYMKGYHINDVYKSMCDCWKVPSVNPKTKQPFYSDKPVLIGDGEMDQACNPLYMLMIKHYMPNAQTFLFKNRFHMVGGKDFFEMTQQFIDHPYRKVEVKNKDIVAY